jgi:hypothetical protein
MSGLPESGHGETLAYSFPSATAQSPRLIQRVGEAAKMPFPIPVLLMLAVPPVVVKHVA